MPFLVSDGLRYFGPFGSDAAASAFVHGDPRVAGLLCSVWPLHPPTEEPATEPHTFERRDARATSRAAAKAVAPRTGTQRHRVWRLLQGVRIDDPNEPDGLTDEQIGTALGMSPNSVRPRRLELVQQGFVHDSGRTRPTASGNAATVWIATSTEEPQAHDQEPTTV